MAAQPPDDISATAQAMWKPADVPASPPLLDMAQAEVTYRGLTIGYSTVPGYDGHVLFRTRAQGMTYERMEAIEEEMTARGIITLTGTGNAAIAVIDPAKVR